MKRKDYFYITTYNLVTNGSDGTKCFYRTDPIPGCGVNRRWTSDIMKRPRSTQEKRMYFACDRKYIRRKRSIRYLPDSWDDYVRSDLYDKKGWKKKKIKKQWMKHL